MIARVILFLLSLGVVGLVWRYMSRLTKTGILYVVIGALCNFTVVTLNQSCMPVVGLLHDDSDGLHCAVTEGTRLLGLIDRFRLGHYVYSAGDVFAITGLLVVLTGAILQCYRAF